MALRRAPLSRASRVGVTLALAGGLVAAFGISSVAGAEPPPKGPPAVLEVQHTSAYGTILVATLTVTGTRGLFPLYLITSDHPPEFGCTTVLVETTYEGPLHCTGPFQGEATPTTVEWPALTTTGPVVAGPGVNRSLVGTVRRPGVGDQVTYAGHPLYLFSGPTTFVGEGFLETVLPLPPWHGLWDLVSASTGNPATGRAVLEPGTTPTHGTVLSAEEYPVAVPGGAAIAVYEFCPGLPGPSRGCPPEGVDPANDSHGPTATWIPLLTQGSPQGTGVTTRDLGTVRTTEGTQVTYQGHPLYLYAQERAVFETKTGTLVPQTTGTQGNGTGRPGPGGIARLVPLFP